MTSPLQEALDMNGLTPGQLISMALREKPDTALMNIEFRGYSIPSPDKQSQKVTLVSLFVITPIAQIIKVSDFCHKTECLKYFF